MQILEQQVLEIVSSDHVFINNKKIYSFTSH